MSPRRILYSAILLFAYLAGTVLFTLNTPFPTGFDELAHLSYIKAMAEAPVLFSRHEDLKQLDADRLSTWSDRTNHLPHPTAYYLTMSLLVGDEITKSDIVMLRLTDVAFGLVAILAVFAAMAGRIRRDAAFVAGASLMALCPMLSVVGGSISNDVFAVAAGALALLAVLRLTDAGPGPAAALLAGLALALAGLTKLNVALSIGVFLVVFHVIALRQLPWRAPRWIGHIAIVSVFGLVGAAPYLVNLLRYGFLIYIDPTIHIPQIADTEPWSFWHYTVWFVQELGDTWSAYEPADAIEMSQIALLLGLPILACRSVVPRSMRWTAYAALAAIIVVLPIHLAFAYRLHVETLYLTAAQSRYYLAFVPVLSFAAAAGLDSIGGSTLRRGLAGVTLAVTIYASLVPAAVRTYLDWRS